MVTFLYPNPNGFDKYLELYTNNSKKNSQIPAQASFFCSGKWIQEMDYVLLTTLIEKRIGHGWDDASVPNYVLRFCVKLINRRFGSELTCSDITTRLMLLKQRYDTFKALVATTGVRWEYVDKIIVANEAVWKGVLIVEEATEVITLFDNTEIVVITDTIEPNAPVRGRVKELDVDLDEVNSPSPGAALRVRRKLFHIDEVNLDLDHLSSSKSPSHVIPTKKVMGASPKGSSWASWSPLPMSRKTAP
ncbi:hypothetical protein SASPL_118365 [Salvia splendens]|uniref:Myb/SANT-like domain-containing protein n=1 Tax=Salvia splendens TaxID=180675 RepID=A0A8X8XX75_SALSN|nr:hypothetical protein SASPL_118365 [Salvia splendens]